MKRTLILLFFLLPLTGLAQKKPLAFTASLFNESTAIPFTRFFTTPVHPGLQAGMEFDYGKEKPHYRIFQTAMLSYFYHNHLAQGFALSSEFGYEYRFRFGLALSALIGVGYMHTFTTAEEFTFVDGAYVKKTDRGNARLYPSLSFDVGYYLLKGKTTSPKLFVRYQSWAEYPYSPGFIPIMTHINLHIGVKFFINRKALQHE
jgi:hypothetical protein